MYYLIKGETIVGKADVSPNIEDLRKVDVEAVEDIRDLDITTHEYVDGVIREKPIVEYIPTKEDKINTIKAEYEPRFKTLEEAQCRLALMNKPTKAISTQYITLNAEMVARIKEIK